jgi:hypothetical protein
MDILSFKENTEYEIILSKLKLDEARKRWVAAYPFNMLVGWLIDNYLQAKEYMSKMEARLEKTGKLNEFNQQFQDHVDRGEWGFPGQRCWQQMCSLRKMCWDKREAHHSWLTGSKSDRSRIYRAKALPVLQASHPMAELYMKKAHEKGHEGIISSLHRSRKDVWVVNGWSLAETIKTHVLSAGLR